jgi:transcriptional regulator with XRE-family HTH domain
MASADRLATFRKQKGLTQKALADAVGMPLIQINRYEAGSSSPNLEAIRRLAVVLGVTADELVFDDAERGRRRTPHSVRGRLEVRAGREDRQGSP